jgi:hypothetical protein
LPVYLRKILVSISAREALTRRTGRIVPEQPTIIIQNSNQQNNDGCGSGCGSGCGAIILMAILLYPISMVGEALDGKAASWWIPLGIFLTLVEIVLIGGGIFAWLDQKFGWGYIDGSRAAARSRSSGTVAPEDLAGDASNYGMPGEEPEKSQVETRKTQGRRVPHPDDPPKPRPITGPVRGVNQRVDLPGGRGQEPQGDVYERLRRLKGLLDEGHITEEEYATKKEELLKLL